MKIKKSELRKIILQEAARLSEENTFGNLPGGAELDEALEHLKAAEASLHMYEMTANEYRHEDLDEALKLIQQAIAKIDPAHPSAARPPGPSRGVRG